MLRPVWLRLFFRRLLIFVTTLLVVGLLGATLVRLAPGFGVDERELDSRLRQESIQSIQKGNAGERNVVQFYVTYIQRLSHGDLGYSRSLARPIAELFTERYAVTLFTVTFGLIGGWTAGFLAAAIVTISRLRIANLFFRS